MASVMIRAIARISVVPNPRVVVAGVPRRIPEACVRRQRVERDRVLVDRDPDFVEERLSLLAGDTERRHVDEHQVVVRAARDDPGPAFSERIGELGRVLDRSPLVALERLTGGELQADGLARDHVHQRPTLDAGEHGLVDLRRERRLDGREIGLVHARRELLAAEDQAAATAAERLVRGRRDDVGMWERARMDTRRDQPGDVGHVDEEQRPDRVGDLGHAREVDDPGIGRGAGDHDLGADLSCRRLESVVVDALGLLVDAVRVDLVQPARRS
jgi:hypothetical protein